MRDSILFYQEIVSVLLKEYRPKEVPIFQRSSRQMGMLGKINLVTRRVVR